MTGAARIEGCNVCSDGYYTAENSTGPCMPCPAGAWCSSNEIRGFCESAKTSPPRSGSAAECVCRDGLSLDAETGKCLPCPDGNFCVNGEAIECTQANCTSGMSARVCSGHADADFGAVCCEASAINNGRQCIEPLEEGPTWQMQTKQVDGVQAALVARYPDTGTGESVLLLGTGSKLKRLRVRGPDTEGATEFSIEAEDIELNVDAQNNHDIDWYDANSTVFQNIQGIALAPDGRAYISDLSNQALYSLSATGLVRLNSAHGYHCNNGAFPNVTFSYPRGVAVSEHRVYIADEGCGVRTFDMSEQIVSTDSERYWHKNATSSKIEPVRLAAVGGVAASAHHLFVADIDENVVWKVVLSTGEAELLGGGERIALYGRLSLSPDHRRLLIPGSEPGVYYVADTGDVAAGYETVNTNISTVLTFLEAGPGGDYILVFSEEQAIRTLRAQCNTGYAAFLECVACDYSTECPAHTYAETCSSGQLSPAAECRACPANSHSEAGSTAISACKCNAGFYLLAGECRPRSCEQGEYNSPTDGHCTPCPEGSYCTFHAGVQPCPRNSTSPARSKSVDSCMCEVPVFWLAHTEGGFVCAEQCSPGSYYDRTTRECKNCSSGYFCESGRDAVPCGEGVLSGEGATSLGDCYCALGHAPVAGSCALSHCGNGVLEEVGGEQCDDGNTVPGDGCGATCMFEDRCNCTRGADFVCENHALKPTECCQSRINPISEAYVCGCEGQTSGSEGFSVLADCSTSDVNECLEDNGGCAANAVCENSNSYETGVTHTCNCPTGKVGDGYNLCDVYIYESSVQIRVQGLLAANFREAALVSELALYQDIFQGKSIHDFRVKFEQVQQAGSRRLLTAAAGDVYVSVQADDHDSVQENVKRWNERLGAFTTKLAAFFEKPVAVVHAPTAAVNSVAADGSVGSVATGFQVESVSFDTARSELLVTVTYLPGSASTITSLYTSRTSSSIQAEAATDSLHVSRHPCMSSTNPCCLRSYSERYHVGAFAQNISAAVDACSDYVGGVNTIDMFDAASNDQLLSNALSGLQGSRVSRISESRLVLHINRKALREQVAEHRLFPGGEQMDLFVGMAYYTLLPAERVATVVYQTRISVQVTEGIVLVTSSEAGVGSLEYLTLGLFETKYAGSDSESEGDLMHLQYVQAGLVLADGVSQNMQTGLIPLNSIRYAVAASVPDTGNQSVWNNPCFSSDGSGGFDNVTTSLRAAYLLASEQDCAQEAAFCENPASQAISGNTVNYWLPIGDGTVNSGLIGRGLNHSLFMTLTVSAALADGKRSVVKVFAQAALEDLALTSMCGGPTNSSEIEETEDEDVQHPTLFPIL